MAPFNFWFLQNLIDSSLIKSKSDEPALLIASFSEDTTEASNISSVSSFIFTFITSIVGGDLNSTTWLFIHLTIKEVASDSKYL